MYPVSQQFLTTINSNARRYYWTGTITTKNNQVYNFDNDDIIKGSGYITRSCCGNNSLEIGTVYASEMGITLLSSIDRYTLKGAEVRLYFHLYLPDGTVETVPMGIFEVSEATRKTRCLEIKAYDYMLRFDEPFNIEATSGTPYNFISTICQLCNVQMAQTQAQIAALPNGTETLGIYSTNDIESYRDLLYYIAQVLGCVAQINREGKLEFIKYSNTPVCEITQRQRYSSSYSDFVTRYTAISSTNMVAEEAEYYALETDDGLTMNLGTNPLLQFGLKATRQRILTKVLNAIAVAEYVPFSSETIGNPALDPMDCLTFSGGHADDTKITCITSITYKINGKHSLKCVGQNPKLSEAKSKNDKNITGLLNQVVENKTTVYDFTNVSPYTITSANLEAISIDYISKESTSAMFLAEILMEVTADETTKEMTATATAEDGTEQTITWNVTEKQHPLLTITYSINGTEVEMFHPKQSLHDGSYLLTLFYPITTILENTSNFFTVSFSISGGSATIAEGRIKATISGQGLVSGVADWNGRIKLEEVFSTYTVGDFTYAHTPLTDSVTITQPAIRNLGYYTAFPHILATFSPVNVLGINERVTLAEIVGTFTVDSSYLGQFDSRYVEINDNNAYANIKEYTFESETLEVSSGSLEHLHIDTSQFENHTSLEVIKC